MATMPKEIAVYQSGELVMLGSAERIADELDVEATEIRKAIAYERPLVVGKNVFSVKYTGRRTTSDVVEDARGRKRKYFPVFPAAHKPKKTIPLIDLDAICKVEGKEYGVLQAEIAAGREISKDEISRAKAEMKKRKAERLKRVTERKGK